MPRYRQIRPEITAWVRDAFEPSDAAGTMEKLAEIVAWYQAGKVYHEPEDAVLAAVAAVQRDAMFGQDALPTPPPRMPEAEFARRMAENFDEVMKKPIPARLYGEGR